MVGMITFFDLLRYWAGFNIWLDKTWIDVLEHKLICLTNKNPNYTCRHNF